MQEDSFTGDTRYTEQLDAVRAGDDKTLQQLYRDNYRYVEKFVLENSGTAEQAKDIFQEAFLSMWRNVQEKRFVMKETGSLSAYLQRIAKNKWLDYLRSASYKKTVLLEKEIAESIPVEDVTDENELAEIKKVREKFKLLGDNCRELLASFYYRGESLRSIARAFEWTEDTAKNNKYRCIERLRKLLKNANTSS